MQRRSLRRPWHPGRAALSHGSLGQLAHPGDEAPSCGGVRGRGKRGSASWAQFPIPGPSGKKPRKSHPPLPPDQRTPFPLHPSLCGLQVLPCSLAQKGSKQGAARAIGERSWPFRQQAQLRRRRRCLEVSSAPEKRNTRGSRATVAVFGAAARPFGFSEPQVVCPLARFICSARARSVPAR